MCKQRTEERKVRCYDSLMAATAERGFSRLVLAANRLALEYAEDSARWAGSPLEWLKNISSSRRKGKAIEMLIERWLSSESFDVRPSGDSEADRLIGGRRVEIKGSTLWENGTYKFQQIRNQRYDFLICLGLSPFEAHCWVLPKELALREATPQHGGSRGRDTFWITVDPKSPEGWLRPRNGDLDEALTLIQEATESRSQ